MDSVLIFGVGPGLGSALARRFARGRLRVGIVARDVGRLEQMLDDLNAAGAPDAQAFACDVGSPQFVAEAFRAAESAFGSPRCVIYNATSFVPRNLLETTPDEFERCWRIGCMGGFLVGQAAAQTMLAAPPLANDGSRGSILYTGASASVRGRAGFHNLAVGKFGLRALAQSMARELGPQGIHVAHTIIDGQIRSAGQLGAPTGEGASDDAELDPEAIAEAYWHLYQQPRSAWTQELDLRPWVEPF